jgi:hypothetical protein
MPKIGNVSWSEKDTKAELMDKATDAGLDCAASMTKADIVAMMEAASDVEPVTAEPVIERVPLPFTTTPATKPAKPAVKGVLGLLTKATKPVSFEKLIESCGPSAKEEVKKLVAEGKVTQYKVVNKFFFKLA